MKKKLIRNFTVMTLGASVLFSGIAFGLETPDVAATSGEVPAAPVSETVVAETPIDGTDGLYVAKKEASNVVVYGTMTKLDENQILLQNDDENDSYGEIVLNVTEDTLIVDAASGEPVAFDTLKDGEILYAYASRAMTRSLPPISNAEILICNIPQDATAPHYLEVQSVLSQEEGTVILSTDHSVNLTVNEDCEITPYQTKNIVTAADLTPGTKVLAWYDVMTLSEPAQAVPTKLMVFPYSYTGYAELKADGSLFVNGEALALDENTAVYEENDEIMLPLRKVCEAMGYSVGWSNENKTITVADTTGQIIVEFAAGESETDIPSQLKNGTTFVAETLMEGFLNIPVVQKY